MDKQRPLMWGISKEEVQRRIEELEKEQREAAILAALIKREKRHQPPARKEQKPL